MQEAAADFRIRVDVAVVGESDPGLRRDAVPRVEGQAGCLNQRDDYEQRVDREGREDEEVPGAFGWIPDLEAAGRPLVRGRPACDRRGLSARRRSHAFTAPCSVTE